MKKIYYIGEKGKLKKISSKKLESEYIYTKGVDDAKKQLKSKGIEVDKKKSKELAKIFVNNNVLRNLNDFIRKSIDFVNKHTSWSTILFCIFIASIINFTILMLFKYRLPISFSFSQSSLLDSYKNISIVIAIISFIWQIFLIPNRRIIAIEAVVVFFSYFIMGIILEKKGLMNIDFTKGIIIIKIGNNIGNIGVFFLILNCINSILVGIIIYNILKSIYNWIFGKNGGMEAPKLSFIWTILAFILGLILKK